MENSKAHTVDWTRPHTGVAVGKANAIFSERPAQLFHLLWWVCARGHDKGTAGDLSGGPKGRGCHTSPPVRSPILLQ